jgi:hypothetical protein
MYVELYQQVKEMRKLQKAYFSSRSPEVLKAAKQYERRVDIMIDQMDNANARLFNLTPEQDPAEVAMQQRR